MKKRISVKWLIACLVTVCFIGADAKKPLDHDALDSWAKLRNYFLTNNGEWNVAAIAPGAGDARLIFTNTRNGKEIVLERGYKPAFSSDSQWAVALIKPLYEDTRKAKIDGKKDLGLPQDSLAIINLKTGRVEKIANVKSFEIGKKGGNWIAYQSVDTIYANEKDLKDKDAGKPLIIRTFDGKSSKVIRWVDNYVFPQDGSKLAVTISKPANDSITTNGLGVMLLPDTAFFLIDRDKKHYGVPVFDEKGNQLAYIAGNDSVKTGTKRLNLYVSQMHDIMRDPKEINFDVNFPTSPGIHLKRPDTKNDPYLQGKEIREWAERNNRTRNDSLFINQYSRPEFSYNGKRLIVGVAPYIAPDDTTIVDFERADLDIWRWDAPVTPPQEKVGLEKTRKLQFPVVIDLENDNFQLINRQQYATVSAPDRWDGDWALINDPTPNIIERQWSYENKESLTVVNVNDGKKKFVAEVTEDNSMLSPGDRFVVYYADRKYYSYEIATGKTACISEGITEPLWDVDNDRPMEPLPYGIAAWIENDENVMVYDKYDIWVLDPLGVKAPYMLTDGVGKKEQKEYRYRKLDDEQRFVKPGQMMVLDVFDYKDKCRGFATVKFNGKAQKPQLRIFQEASFTMLRKAKDADVFSWQRASFDIAPNIWIATSYNFDKAKIVTDANPQMKDYSWGTAQLFKWTAYDGKPAEGILYLPEEFDPSKEYPMLAVFYERNSRNLYTHYAMEPSWSWINYPFYVSRGYVVFVPDIIYETGQPGESAYNYVCSGVEAVCDTYPNIDRKRIGIDGQSWGGYQTAYLITRTNMFACAGSGAPVANMTSAFGGIRWESGDSRQAQYEMGQSRIGQNLWEAPELYISNSPLFRADKVNTPLLIMHNDADGAVPWYQGIEMFMALRRLQKPVWMLQYNGEMHNLKERKNCKDITVRLQQFFDHYLKGDPMPRWMIEGIPAIRKGQDLGY